jgi:nitrogen fixation NifU-like protein
LDDEIYQERILEHYEDPYHRGPCPGATHAHEDDNPLCGDNVHVELRVSPAGKIDAAWFQGEGCCISQASASMLMEKIEGSTVEEAKRFAAQDMLELFGARLTPNRQKCCLLSWRVLQGAIFSSLGGDGAAQPAAGPRGPRTPSVEAARDTRGGDGPG